MLRGRAEYLRLLVKIAKKRKKMEIILETILKNRKIKSYVGPT